MEFSFAEQIKIILNRKNMTIQDLANLYEAKTGQKMTRQNLSQRLKRDNFPEQDMHTIAALLGYQVSIQLNPIGTVKTPSILEQPEAAPVPVSAAQIPKKVQTADGSTVQIPEFFKKAPVQGDVNPLTGEEYLTNTVRQHPTLPNYLQVYDQSTHEWSDVNEDYFWEFQASKKQILGTDYQEPILI
jgi:hypothetical protein